MQLSHLGVDDSRGVDRDAMDANRCRRCRVRIPILSKELLVLVVLLGVAGSLTGFLQDGQHVRRNDKTSLRGHDNLVGTVLFQADGRTMVTCGWDRQVKLWQVAEGEPGWGDEIQTLPHDWHVCAIAISPDGKHLLVSGVGGVAFWEQTPASGWVKVREQGGLSCRSVAIAPDGRTVALLCSDRTIRLWDLVSMKELRDLGRAPDELRAVEFSPDGAWLATSTFGGVLRLWDLTSKAREPIERQTPKAVESFTFVPGTRILAIAQSAEDTKGLFLWDPEGSGRRLWFSDNGKGNNALAISPDGRTLASADKDRSIRFWDLATGQLKGTLHEGVGWVRTLAFSPDGRRIAFGGQSGAIQFRDVDQEGRPVDAGRT